MTLLCIHTLHLVFCCYFITLASRNSFPLPLQLKSYFFQKSSLCSSRLTSQTFCCCQFFWAYLFLVLDFFTNFFSILHARISWLSVCRRKYQPLHCPSLYVYWYTFSELFASVRCGGTGSAVCRSSVTALPILHQWPLHCAAWTFLDWLIDWLIDCVRHGGAGSAMCRSSVTALPTLLQWPVYHTAWLSRLTWWRQQRREADDRTAAVTYHERHPATSEASPGRWNRIQVTSNTLSFPR